MMDCLPCDLYIEVCSYVQPCLALRCTCRAFRSACMMCPERMLYSTCPSPVVRARALRDMEHIQCAVHVGPKDMSSCSENNYALIFHLPGNNTDTHTECCQVTHYRWLDRHAMSRVALCTGIRHHMPTEILMREIRCNQREARHLREALGATRRRVVEQMDADIKQAAQREAYARSQLRRTIIRRLVIQRVLDREKRNGVPNGLLSNEY